MLTQQHHTHTDNIYKYIAYIYTVYGCTLLLYMYIYLTGEHKFTFIRSNREDIFACVMFNLFGMNCNCKFIFLRKNIYYYYEYLRTPKG